jgi:hypothetical protein
MKQGASSHRSAAVDEAAAKKQRWAARPPIQGQGRAAVAALKGTESSDQIEAAPMPKGAHTCLVHDTDAAERNGANPKTPAHLTEGSGGSQTFGPFSVNEPCIKIEKVLVKLSNN